VEVFAFLLCHIGLGIFLNLVAVRILSPQWQLRFLKIQRRRMMLNQSIDRLIEK